MLSTFLCANLTQILWVVDIAHRSPFWRIFTMKPYCDSKLTATVYIPTAVWASRRGSMLSMLSSFWSESPLAPSSSSSDAPAVLILILGTNTKNAHTKYLGFWRLSRDSGGGRQFSSPVPWTHCTHSSSYPDPQNCLHSLSRVAFLVSFCFNLFVSFISQ